MSSSYGTGSDEEIQLVPGTLRGYRAWHLGSLDRCCIGLRALAAPLRSISADFQWEPGKALSARCLNVGLVRGHQAPTAGCSCGYYATYRLEDLPGFSLEKQLKCFVFGSVKAYGRVALGIRGFRAEYMEIESLVFTDQLIDLSWLTEMYGTAFVDNFNELCSRFPSSNVDELLETTVSRRGPDAS